MLIVLIVLALVFLGWIADLFKQPSPSVQVNITNTVRGGEVNADLKNRQSESKTYADFERFERERGNADPYFHTNDYTGKRW